MSETPKKYSIKEWKDGYNTGFEDAYQAGRKNIEALEAELKAKPVHFTSDHVTVKMAAPLSVHVAEDALAREYKRGADTQMAFNMARIEELEDLLRECKRNRGEQADYWHRQATEERQKGTERAQDGYNNGFKDASEDARKTIDELHTENQDLKGQLQRAERSRKFAQDVQTDIVFSLDAHDPEGARPSGRTLSDTVEALLEIKDQTIKRLESTLKGLEKNYDKRYEDADRGIRCRRDHIRLEHELQETRKGMKSNREYISRLEGELRDEREALKEAKKERDEYKDVLRRVGDKHAKELQERSAEARKGFNSLGEINTKLYAENQRLERELGEAKDELTIFADARDALSDARTKFLRQINELKQRVKELEAALFEEKTQHKEDLDDHSAVRADLQCRLMEARKDLKEAKRDANPHEHSERKFREALIDVWHLVPVRFHTESGRTLDAVYEVLTELEKVLDERDELREELRQARVQKEYAETTRDDACDKNERLRNDIDRMHAEREALNKAREDAYEMGVRAGMRASGWSVAGEVVVTAEDIERFRQERGI